MPTIIPPRALSTRDLAELTGMTTEFFRLEIVSGEIHAARFGREYRIPAQEAARYLTEKQFPVPVDWLGR